MEARDLAERMKELFDGQDSIERLRLGSATRWAHEDSDFFIDTDDDGTFLVVVMKVSE